MRWYCQIFYDVKAGRYAAFASIAPAGFIKECGALPSNTRVSWNNTFPYPTPLEVYKPYLVFYQSQKDYTVSMIMNEIVHAKKGITFFGKLVLGEERAAMFEAMIFDSFDKSTLDELGTIGGGIIVPSTFLYFKDRVLIAFYPRTRTIDNREYWSFIPVIIFYPVFTEGEDLLNAVVVRFNPLITHCECASSSATYTSCTLASWHCSRLLNRSIYEILQDLTYVEHTFINIRPACNISRYGPTLVDHTHSSRLTTEDGAIVFYIVKTFIDVLFEAFGGEGNLTTILLKYFISSIGYADLTENFALRTFELNMRRSFKDCDHAILEIHKNFHYSAMFRVLNATIYEVPLAGYYIIDPLPHQPPCDNPVAC